MSQSYYNVVIPSTQDYVQSTISPAMELKDSNLLVFVPTSYRSKYGGTAFKLIVSKAGELSTYNKFEDSMNITIPRDIIKYKDYYISCGNKFISNDTLHVLWISKILPTGEFSWEKQLSTTYNRPSFAKCMPYKNETKLVFVGSYDQTLPRSPVSETASGLIVITDSLANFEHFITINDKDTLTLEAYYGVTEDLNHNIFATGLVIKNGQNHDAVVVKVSPQGKVLWRRQYPSPDYIEGYWYAHYQVDSTILLVGASYSAGNIVEDYSNVVMSKVNLNGDILWTKRIMKGFDDAAIVCIGDSSGNIICSGLSHIDQSSKANGLILKFTQGGDSLWSRIINYTDRASEQFNNISKAYDGGYYLTGFSYVEGDNSSKPWIVKTDSFGCVVPGCEKVVSTKDIESGKEKAFVFFPNPVYDRFFFLSRIERSDKHYLMIYNLQGQLMQTYPFTPHLGHQYQVDVNEQISSGEVLLQVRNGMGEILVGEKVVIIRE